MLNQRSTSPNPIAATPARRSCRHLATVVTIAALATASACSGSDGTADGVASVDSVAATDNNDLVFADYEQCMADNGVDLPSLDGGEGNSIDGESETVEEMAEVDEATEEAAAEACDPILEGIDSPIDDLSPDQQAALDDFLVEMQNCLSDKGFDVPLVMQEGNELDDTEIDASDGASATLPADFDWEAFEQAGQECEDQIGIPPELEDLEDF